MPLLKLFNFRETSIKFSVAGLPFVFSGWGSRWLKKFTVSIHLQSQHAPLVAYLAGIDHMHPLTVAQNELGLPEEFLRDIFLMVRNRVIIEAQKNRGADPTKKTVSGESMWHWYDFDRRNACNKWAEIAPSFMEKMAKGFKG